MEIKIIIDDKLIERCKTAFSRHKLAVAAALLCLVASTLAWAVPGDPISQFSGGDPLSAADLNSTFQEVIDQIVEVDS